jgi:hypothetical protein
MYSSIYIFGTHSLVPVTLFNIAFSDYMFYIFEVKEFDRFITKTVPVLNQASPIQQKRLLCQQKQVRTVGFRNVLLDGSRLKNVTVSSQSLGGRRKTTVTIVILWNKSQCKAQPLSDGRKWGSILWA